MSNTCKFCGRPFVKVGKGQVYCKRPDCAAKKRSRMRYVKNVLGVTWGRYERKN